MKNIRYVNIFLISFFFIGNSIFSQDFKKTATSGFAFLQIPTSARTASLGEASIALADMHSDAVFRNPGALGFTPNNHSLSLSYAPWFADIKHYSLSYAFSSNAGVFGIGIIMLDYGTIPRTIIGAGQKVFNELGNFNANSMVMGMTYSRRLNDKFSFGVTLKYVQEKIDIYKASNILFDGGVLYYTGLSSLRIAMSIQNFGVDSKFINDDFKMPAILRLGTAFELIGEMGSDYRWSLIVEALHPNDGEERINVGSEFDWYEIIKLRGGYKFFYDEESYSFGVGINPQLSYPINFDFAYSDYGRLGNVTRFTIQLGVSR